MPLAGRLHERLRFQRRLEVSTDLGGAEGEWVDVCTVAARVTPIPPTTATAEVVLARRLTGVVLYQVTVRDCAATASLGADCRAVDTRKARTFNVRSVVDIGERSQFLTLLCETGVADG